MGRLTMIGLVCSGVSLGFIVVSTAIPYWTHRIENKANTYIGLWTFCTKKEKDKVATCGEIYSFEEYYMAVRAFVLLGLFQVTIAAILAVIRLFSTKGNPNVSIGAGVIAISAGVCMLIGVIIWGAKTTELADDEKQTTGTKELTVQYHAGLALAVLAAVAALGAGILLIVGRQNPIQT